KLLQLMPTPHCIESHNLVVKKQEFDSVCETLRVFNPICEDNLHMKEAYWIVDSEGFYGKDNLHLSDIAKVSLLN
ncbi:MAG TPA: hypothetical protein VJZ31_02445, partial [Bacilli bacterium]|nr:hypothetical protein [Bacilli bacterium]